MGSGAEEDLGTYTLWAYGYEDNGVKRALDDQRTLRRGQLNDGNLDTRVTPSQPSESHSRKLRSDRDDLDYREWNSESGFSGVDRWPASPGVLSEGQKRRRARMAELDDGF
ncbi:MAG: hypothetical protein EP329_26680 [Deltaproteobacteria bacterium]|nr:MAG: hypothetical protein EP329_26680 [Deltaproteobacteria bacterium]